MSYVVYDREDLTFHRGGGEWTYHVELALKYETSEAAEAARHDVDNEGILNLMVVELNEEGWAPVEVKGIGLLPELSRYLLKPSELEIRSHAFPFIGTLGRAELEIGAGWLVAYLQENGDEWKPVRPSEIGAWLKQKMRANKEAGTRFDPHWIDNPFARPDMAGLADAGYAVIGEKPNPTMKLLPATVELLAKKWRKPS